jgi:hypothetical protein
MFFRKGNKPPFPLHVTSPHGNPSHIGEPKDINLPLPPARKKVKLDKVWSQGTAGSDTFAEDDDEGPSPSLQY